MTAATGVLFLLFVVPAAKGDGSPSPDTAAVRVVEVESTYQGHRVRWWAHRAVQARRDANARMLTIHRLKQRWRPSVLYALRLAAAVTGVPYSDLWTVSRCESGHNPFATNGRYRGLFQEGPMFESSVIGHAGFSVWDPLANSLVAAMTVVHDGGFRQWQCSP